MDSIRRQASASRSPCRTGRARSTWARALVAAALLGAVPARAEAAEAPVQSPDTRAEEESGWSVVPFVLPAYQPETSWLLGGAAVLVHQPEGHGGQRESQLLFAGAASTRKQFSGLLQPDVYLLGDRLQLGGTLSAAKFPDEFFGVGSDTAGSASEPYTPLLYELEFSPRWRIAPSLYLGPGVRVQQVELPEVAPGGQLDSAQVTGARGGRTVQLGLSGFWDTRDNTLYPTQGVLVRLNLRSARPELGSDFRFDVLRLDARQYVSLPWSSRHLLAVQGVLELRRGEPPFYDLGKLGGGEMMRGYYEGRYRDRQLVALQAEYRAWLFWRVGGVLFASAGTVARSVSALQLDRLRSAVGAGLRVAPLADVPINFRLDVAYGSTMSFYLNVGEAF
jgi:outer membrane protein assembly factor BamA